MRLSSATSLFAVLLLLLLSVLCFLGAEAHSARRRRGAAEQEPSKVGSFVRHGKSLMASLMGSSSSSEGAEGGNEDGGDGEASVEDASEGEEKAKPPPPQVDGITPKRKSGVPSDDPEVDRSQRDIPPHEQQHHGRPPPWQQQPPPFMPGGFPRGPPQHPRPPHMMMQQQQPPPPPNYPQRFPHSQRLNYDWFQGPVNVDQIFRDLRFTPPPPSSSSSYPGRRPTTVSTTSRKQMAPNKPLYPNMFEDTREAVPNRRHVSFGAR